MVEIHGDPVFGIRCIDQRLGDSVAEVGVHDARVGDVRVFIARVCGGRVIDGSVEHRVGVGSRVERIVTEIVTAEGEEREK